MNKRIKFKRNDNILTFASANYLNGKGLIIEEKLHKGFSTDVKTRFGLTINDARELRDFLNVFLGE